MAAYAHAHTHPFLGGKFKRGALLYMYHHFNLAPMIADAAKTNEVFLVLNDG